MADIHRIRPRSAIVVGAGIVGLSTAWFLQERGVSVTVVDRTGVAAGASWGNAGWIAPALSIPLNDPRTLRYALRSLPNRAAPVRIPLSLDPTLWRFLLRFAANCRESSWTRAVRANLTLNHECIAAYDVLVSSGVVLLASGVGWMFAPETRVEGHTPPPAEWEAGTASELA